MDMSLHQWTCHSINGHASPSMNMPLFQWTCHSFYGHATPSMDCHSISGHATPSMDMSLHQWTCHSFNGHATPSMDIPLHQWSFTGNYFAVPFNFHLLFVEKLLCKMCPPVFRKMREIIFERSWIQGELILGTVNAVFE